MKLDLSLSLGKLRRLLTKFLTFNGTTSYGEMVDAWESTDGDWTAEVVFEGLNAGGVNRYLLDTVADGSNRSYIFITDYDKIRFDPATASCTFDGESISTDRVNPTDDKLHTIILSGTDVAKFGFIGQRYSNEQFFNGTIKSLTLTDNTTPSNSREYNLNSGSTTHIVDSLDPTNTDKYITLNNVSASDWDNYYFDRCLGDSGGWINKADSEDIILIA